MKVKSHPNIALLKYWGKRNKILNLPAVDSISMTVDKFHTITQFEISENDEDKFFLNQLAQSHKNWQRGYDLLSEIRREYPNIPFLTVKSTNNFPTAAGLASSASAFSALIVGLNHFCKLEMEKSQIQKWTRIGSGSAVRSLFSGFCHLNRGEKEDGSDCYARQIEMEDWKEIRLSVFSSSHSKKEVSSRKGMANAYSAPGFNSWVEWQQSSIHEFIDALRDHDLESLGPLVQNSALTMHQCMWSQNPPINYWTEKSFLLWQNLWRLQNQNPGNYFGTMDAGPHLKVLHLEENLPDLLNAFSPFLEDNSISLNTLGPGLAPSILEE